VGQAKQKRLSIKDCYLCRKPLEEPTSPDHVPPKLFFPEDLRKKYKLTELLTIRVHHACIARHKPGPAWRETRVAFVLRANS